MSVLIKGMEMPKQCYDCYLIAKDPDCEKLYCKHLNQDITDWSDVLKDCPLVEVPTPHGNLIDIDLVMNMLKTEKILIHRIAGKTEIPFYRLEDLLVDTEYVVIEKEYEQVYNRYYDTAGNYHWTGVHTGEHEVEGGE